MRPPSPLHPRTSGRYTDVVLSLLFNAWFNVYVRWHNLHRDIWSVSVQAFNVPNTVESNLETQNRFLWANPIEWNRNLFFQSKCCIFTRIPRLAVPPHFRLVHLFRTDQNFSYLCIIIQLLLHDLVKKLIIWFNSRLLIHSSMEFDLKTR